MRHLLPAFALTVLLALTAASQDGQPNPAPPSNTGKTPARDSKSVRIATWNIENWRDHFEAWRRRDQQPADEAAQNALRQEGFQNGEDNWEIAQVFLDPAFAPDILVFQEGCAQAELEEFNTTWLGGMFVTVLVFASNDERGQTIGIMLRPGFKLLAREDDFHKLPDHPEDLNPRSEYLFARGPAVALVETPGGARLWVGTNHQKSKGGGNDVAITRWRNAEAAATHQIMKDLVARGPEQLVFLGDMNDQLGIQAYELEGGGDVIANLAGPPEDGFVLATRQLAVEGQPSYLGYWRTDHRTLVDHVVLSPALAGAAAGVSVFDTPWARVASDHLPVYVDLRLPAARR